MKESTRERLESIAYFVDCSLLSMALAISIGILVKSIALETVSMGRFLLHIYVIGGFLGFFLLLLIPRVKKNVRWLMVFTHEFTHMIFAALFMRRLHKFHVDDKGDSHIYYSNGPLGYIPITLSPYCVPLFTLALLPWRLTTDMSSRYFLIVIDLLIGLSYAFHMCCWIKQTRYYQTDIMGPGKLRSSLFIALFWMLGFSLVTLTPGSGVLKAFTRCFWIFPRELVMEASDFIRSIFAYII